jgi:hypothetical protein
MWFVAGLILGAIAGFSAACLFRARPPKLPEREPENVEAFYRPRRAA